MPVQVFYHLCRLGFIVEDDESIQTFRNKACLSSSNAAQGIYASFGLTPFLKVCGRCFHLQRHPSGPDRACQAVAAQGAGDPLFRADGAGKG